MNINQWQPQIVCKTFENQEKVNAFEKSMKPPG